MLQRLPIALVLENSNDTSKNLLNKIRQITYSLYRANEITKKLCNNNELNKDIKQSAY